MSNQQAQAGEKEPGTSQPDAYFDEVSGLREKYDSHILPADYKYKVEHHYPDYYNPRFVNIPTVIVLVGLPARGKTYVAKKLGRYLNWIGIKTKVFNVGEYRRNVVGADRKHDFFRADNTEAIEIRRGCAMDALKDVARWFSNREGFVAIFDATNTTRERRKMVLDFCEERGYKVFFIESVCEDAEIVSENIGQVKVFSPDYKTMQSDEAVEDFKKRIEHYKATYEPLSVEADEQLSFIKNINCGQQFVVNRSHGYVQSRVVYYLMNTHVQRRSIYLTRHGESLYNLEQRIGGNPDLSPGGKEFAMRLGEYMNKQKIPNLKVWTSQLKRAFHTAESIDAPIEQWKALNELEAGIFDGMTYDEVQEKYPEEHDQRYQDKFKYRSPRGESYNDLKVRLEPVIMELERQQNILVICHQAVLRVLLAYFLDHPSDQLPYMRVPLHTVYKLTPIAFGCRVEKIAIDVDAVDTHVPHPSRASKGEESPLSQSLST
ncbi:LOW QUALITY PROTEIN: 6-phosphofructo-2-kinase/fructose-2,6-bisphosphatase-like [Dendronephthya gigantea]|uniref:LOW QUALITY PROTEIN: 6-phosphofructo-2-kinase/fructose-2,6-bisphosphatase-like n=1 Tax=Dendronephthya gigantea TaxID=151771 RepID=UPI00106B09EA|nr:LOW QUALITY PROTEIN: 6-phosphofructo-2-kinase/fructose-2,6-bisphosphatase-like [Dendronephthya gigantea]